MPLAFIGLGSNLGDRQSLIYVAIDKINQLDGIRVTRTSDLYASAAHDSPPGSPNYLNAVAEVSTTLTPTQLLTSLQTIEHMLGRERPADVRNAPRSIDLDLLLYEGLVLETPELTLPHPRMNERAFVLAPLCELYPAFVHPTTGQTLSTHYEQIKPTATPAVRLNNIKSMVLDKRGLTPVDRLAGGIGLAAALLVATVVFGSSFLVLLQLEPDLLPISVFGLLLSAIGGYGLIRYHRAAERLDRYVRTLPPDDDADDVGHGFEVLDAEVVAEASLPSPDASVPDDQRDAASP